MRLFIKDKGFYLTAAKISIPIAAQSLITVAINLLDTVMLGQLGETAISGSALANQFIGIFQILCMGMGMGRVGAHFPVLGMKDLPSLKKSITIMYRFCFILASIFTLLTAFFPSFLIHLYTNEAGAAALGVEYFRYSIPTYLLMGFSLTTTLVLRSVGLVHLPLITSIGAFFVNVIFNYCFIFGNFGFPRMEVAGAALATVIARAFEFLIICGYFWMVEKKVGYRIKDLFVKCSDLVREYFRISFPVLISDGLLAFGNSVVTSVIGHMGGKLRICQLHYGGNPATEHRTGTRVSQASAIITGHTLGRGKIKKAEDQGYAFLDWAWSWAWLPAVSLWLPVNP